MTTKIWIIFYVLTPFSGTLLSLWWVDKVVHFYFPVDTDFNAFGTDYRKHCYHSAHEIINLGDAGYQVIVYDSIMIGDDYVISLKPLKNGGDGYYVWLRYRVSNEMIERRLVYLPKFLVKIKRVLKNL